MMDSTLSLTTGQHINFTPHGIDIVGEMTLPQWTEILNTLHAVKGAYHCALADVIHYGHEKFGEAEVAQALNQAEFEMNDVVKATNIGQLSLKFRQYFRLSSEHYFVLSKLTEPKEQAKWGQIAMSEKLTALELKRSIEGGKLIRTSTIQQNSGQGSGINTIQGAVFKMSQWEKAMGGINNIVKLPKEERRKLLDLLLPTITLAAAIEGSLSETE